jgi:hypothetical protein
MKRDHRADEFVNQAAGKRQSLPVELLAFLRDNRKWWLAPMILAVLVLGLLVMLGSTAAAPFIYTLF